MIQALQVGKYIDYDSDDEIEWFNNRGNPAACANLYLPTGPYDIMKGSD